MNKHWKQLLGTLFGFSLVIGVIAVLSPAPEVPPVAQVPVITYKQNPTILAEAGELGINVSKMNLTYGVYNPNAQGDATNPSQVVGYFEAPNSIFIRSGSTHEEEVKTLAYEYMHYVYLNSPNQASSKQLYANYLSKDRWMIQRLSVYNCSGNPDPTGCITDEALASACTEFPPSYWTVAFNNFCDKAVPNRSLLF